MSACWRTSRAPNQSTSAVATATKRSTLRSRLAESRLARTPARRLFAFALEKASEKVRSRESACTILIAPIDSTAVAAMAPSRCRCFRDASLMSPLSFTVRIQKSGAVASARTASSHRSQSMSPTIPKRTSVLAASGRMAVTATSLMTPTSLMTRNASSPLRDLVWKESERY